MEPARPARAGQEWMTEGFRVRMAPLADFSIDSGGLAQLARAPALQAGGQRFESVILHTSAIEKGNRVGDSTPEGCTCAENFDILEKETYKRYKRSNRKITA